MAWRHATWAAALAAAAAAAEPEYPVFPGERLSLGRTVWLGTCEGCHAYGIAGAPDPREPEAWTHRLAKPLAVLHDHAINGWFGPEDTYMPPRGGNDGLSDTEVKAAADYMLEFARQTIQHERTTQ